MAVPFTQFLRPNGARRHVEIELDDEAEQKATKIIEAGYRFECEELMTGHASFTIAGYDPTTEEDGDVVHKLCMNGPKVPETVRALIMEFDLDAIPQSST